MNCKNIKGKVIFGYNKILGSMMVITVTRNICILFLMSSLFSVNGQDVNWSKSSSLSNNDNLEQPRKGINQFIFVSSLNGNKNHPSTFQLNNGSLVVESYHGYEKLVYHTYNSNLDLIKRIETPFKGVLLKTVRLNSKIIAISAKKMENRDLEIFVYEFIENGMRFSDKPNRIGVIELNSARYLPLKFKYEISISPNENMIGIALEFFDYNISEKRFIFSSIDVSNNFNLDQISFASKDLASSKREIRRTGFDNFCINDEGLILASFYKFDENRDKGNWQDDILFYRILRDNKYQAVNVSTNGKYLKDAIISSSDDGFIVCGHFTLESAGIVNKGIYKLNLDKSGEQLSFISFDIDESFFEVKRNLESSIFIPRTIVIKGDTLLLACEEATILVTNATNPPFKYSHYKFRANIAFPPINGDIYLYVIVKDNIIWKNKIEKVENFNKKGFLGGLPLDLTNSSFNLSVKQSQISLLYAKWNSITDVNRGKIVVKYFGINDGELLEEINICSNSSSGKIGIISTASSLSENRILLYSEYYGRFKIGDYLRE